LPDRADFEVEISKSPRELLVLPPQRTQLLAEDDGQQDYE
jgi:hypothetical protein